jgi:hypothetical protein
VRRGSGLGVDTNLAYQVQLLDPSIVQGVALDIEVVRDFVEAGQPLLILAIRRHLGGREGASDIKAARAISVLNQHPIANRQLPVRCPDLESDRPRGPAARELLG